MTTPTIFDLCTPRADVLSGSLTEADFAADLAQVLRGTGPDDYTNPARFFANTYPTAGLRTLLQQVLTRLSGGSGAVSSIFRLDTQYGGGKTHGLIALCHAARGMQGVANVAEFVDPTLVPLARVRIGAFDGENADPANGAPLGGGLRAYTPWGALAYALDGPDGYERVRRSDEQHVAPGAETIAELFGGEPTLILLDELSVYLRKVAHRPAMRDQLTAFLTSLFKAVETSPRACVVFTLALGKDGKATDAYSSENLFLAEKMAEIESVAARKATILDPTGEDETVRVLRRRLFERIDDAAAASVVAGYKDLWTRHGESLPTTRVGEDRERDLTSSYPFHPALMAVLKGRLSTLQTFQRVRGMLRLLARTVARLWAERPDAAHAIHAHHVDPGTTSIHHELLTRLQLSAFAPAIRSDVAATDAGTAPLAADLDARHYSGLPPYASYVARTALLHTFAFNEELKGCTADELRYSVLAPGLDIAFIEDARKRFIASSAYLDDRPNVPMRFLTEANLTQIIRRQEEQVDPAEARAELNDRIRDLFKAASLELVPFPAGAGDVPDDVGAGKPYLAVLHHESAWVSGEPVTLPDRVEAMFRRRSDTKEDFRRLLNNVVFLVVDAAQREDMRRAVVHRIALGELRKPDRIGQLAPHQQTQVHQAWSKSEQAVASAIQKAYRHVFYPSRHRVDGATCDLGHTVIEQPLSAFSPGQGQIAVLRKLRDAKKIRTDEDQPDSPAYVRDRTPLKKGQISTASLRDEFRKDPSLPMLLGDGVFQKGIRLGIEQGDYVYTSGEMLVGKGDPWPAIRIDESSFVYTMEFARTQGLWPRSQGVKEPEPKPPQKEPPQKPHEQKAKDDPRPEPQPPEPPRPSASLLRAEAPLAQALAEVFGKARAQQIEALSCLHIRVFDASDSLRLLGAVGMATGARRTVTLSAAYETTAGATLDVKFSGPTDDARPLKDFLEPQLRAAVDKELEASYVLDFDGPGGLSVTDGSAERLAATLTRFAVGAAWVEASAEPLAS